MPGGDGQDVDFAAGSGQPEQVGALPDGAGGAYVPVADGEGPLVGPGAQVLAGEAQSINGEISMRLRHSRI